MLHTIPIFAGLRDDALRMLKDAARPLSFHAGDIIVSEGTTGNQMFIVEDGAVEVVKKAGAPDETVLARLPAGDFFGEMSLVEPFVRSASIRSVGESRVLALRSSDLHALFKKWPDQYAIVILNIARDLARRLRVLDEKFCARAH